MLNIVLVEPEIPPNTGNIARLCLATNSNLYLVGKLGFSLENKDLKRAGLDYWYKVNFFLRADLFDLEKEAKLKNPKANFFYFSTKAKTLYNKAAFKDGDFLVFGKETKGLPEDLIKNNPKALTIPMWGQTRSLNLAVSVGIAVYRAYETIDNNFFNE